MEKAIAVQVETRIKKKNFLNEKVKLSIFSIVTYSRLEFVQTVLLAPENGATKRSRL